MENNDQSSHSTSSYLNAVYDEVKTYRVKYVEDLEATAARWLALLRRLTYIYVDGPGGKYVCAICYSDKDDDHADDCELGKELSDG